MVSQGALERNHDAHETQYQGVPPNLFKVMSPFSWFDLYMKKIDTELIISCCRGRVVKTSNPLGCLSFILYHAGTYIFSYILIEITAYKTVIGEDAFISKEKGDGAQW